MPLFYIWIHKYIDFIGAIPRLSFTSLVVLFYLLNSIKNFPSFHTLPKYQINKYALKHRKIVLKLKGGVGLEIKWKAF